MKESKKPGYAERLSAVCAAVSAQRKDICDGKLLGESTKDITRLARREFGSAPYLPRTEHPRMMVTAETLPRVRRALREKNATNVRFKSLLGGTVKDAGCLPPAFEHTTGRKGVHNFDGEVLEQISAKALGYLTESEPLYGYEAILAMKSFLLTLDLGYIYSDQCREFGYVMFVAACVYDWCYPLLTDEDKEQLIAGVETRIASGNSGDLSRGIPAVYMRKMEVGFPPSDQGCVSGHGSERQILRDYLAFAAAIYGDNDSWWSYVAARVYNDYVQARNYYYRSGISQQGTGLYIKGRHISDLYSAWILQTAVGSHPYVGLERTVRSIFGYECTSGFIFTDGDSSGRPRDEKQYLHLAFISAYLFADAAMLRWAEDLLGETALGADTNYLSSVLYVALRGLSAVKAGEDRYAGMPLIQYNGYPLGQYVTHRAWDDPDGCATMLRIKERSTANHEHKDSGTFSVYYKGSLTTGGGCYNNYGHAHTKMFHQMTVSKNGLIVFNPSKLDTSSEDKVLRYYSGSQKLISEMPTLAAWLASENHRTAIQTGHDDGYTPDGAPLFAYIAGNLSGAYDADTVRYAERRMLTVYTGDAEAPMALFVYDDVESTSPDYEKRFLLQIASMDAPTVSENTVITENGEGRLTLVSLSEGVTLRPLGGRAYREDGKYDPDASQNYMLNGENLRTLSGADDQHWGRVEIVAPAVEREIFLDAMYVSDRGADTRREVERLDAEEAVTVLYDRRIAAVFAKSRESVESLSFDLPQGGEISLYVSGLAGGEYAVSCDGCELEPCYVKPTSGLLTASVSGGRITLTKKQ